MLGDTLYKCMLAGCSASKRTLGNIANIAWRSSWLVCRELEALSKGASSEEVERAKAMCEAAVHGALEAPHIVAEDIGRQMITYKRRVPLDEFQQKVQVRDTLTA